VFQPWSKVSVKTGEIFTPTGFRSWPFLLLKARGKNNPRNFHAQVFHLGNICDRVKFLPWAKTYPSNGCIPYPCCFLPWAKSREATWGIKVP
jgi:hypothetical protein